MNSDMARLNNRLRNHLLWPFQSLPENYVVLDTETTGLLDEQGVPGIVSIGIVEVSNGLVVKANEYTVRPHRQMTDEAVEIHGITDKQARAFATFISQWPKIRADLQGNLVVIHNAIFDWSLIIDHIDRYGVDEPSILGVFCSQRAAQPWAKAMGLKCSERGPSLDTLTAAMGVNDLRSDQNGLHSALIDAKQTADVVECLKQFKVDPL